MASIIRQPNGRRAIQYTAPNGNRPMIRLGKITQRGAEAVKNHVEHLHNSKAGRYPVEHSTAQWLAEIDGTLADRLADLGLTGKRINPEDRDIVTLISFVDGYIAGRTDVKPRTKSIYGNTRRNLFTFFGPDKPLADVTPGDADRFRLHLLTGENLAENTARKRISVARMFLKSAVRSKLITENPFDGFKTRMMKVRTREYFVTTDEANRVMDACPDAEWRLIFSLCRFGGLRCPSEVFALKWEHVDWVNNRILVSSCKTEHHEDGESRLIPMFPELLEPLQDKFELAETGDRYVITRYRDNSQNLRTQLKRIIGRAGLEPWPKPFQNLRSSRETELAESWPIHVVCDWLGNSEAVAKTHYLQVTPEHFERAVHPSADTDERRCKKRCSIPQKAPVTGGKPEPGKSKNARFPRENSIIRKKSTCPTTPNGTRTRVSRMRT
jgi:integrase